MHVDLVGPWAGWKIRGLYLVSPWGDRITVEAMTGLALRHGLNTWAHRIARERATAVLHGAVEVTSNVIEFRRVEPHGGG